MAIPTIAPYALPARADLPADRVDWRVESHRGALLIHDMQNYFIDAYDRAAEPMATVIPAIAELRLACRRAGMPVIYTRQPGDQHPDRRGLLAEFWGEGMGTGRPADVIDELAPEHDDVQVTKWRYSAFQRTDLRQTLAYAGRDQLIVTGVYAHMGCMLSAADAFMNDIQPFVVADGTADFSRDEHAMALEYSAKRCGRVVDTADVIASVGAYAM
ncbi:MAG: isochorismatase family protein [Tomitella sp.]|nr:isochorismatase family protein [Tomitella sp.]